MNLTDATAGVNPLMLYLLGGVIVLAVVAFYAMSDFRELDRRDDEY